MCGKACIGVNSTRGSAGVTASIDVGENNAEAGAFRGGVCQNVLVPEESSEGFYQACGRLGCMVWVGGGYECNLHERFGVLVLEMFVFTWGGFFWVWVIVSAGFWGVFLLGVVW